MSNPVIIYFYSERLHGVSTPQCCFHEGKGVLGLGHAVDEDACTLTRFLINQPESTMRGVCVATKALLVATRSHPHFKVMCPLVKILGLGSLGASSQPCCPPAGNTQGPGAPERSPCTTSRPPFTASGSRSYLQSGKCGGSTPGTSSVYHLGSEKPLLKGMQASCHSFLLFLIVLHPRHGIEVQEIVTREICSMATRSGYVLR